MEKDKPLPTPHESTAIGGHIYEIEKQVPDTKAEDEDHIERHGYSADTTITIVAGTSFLLPSVGDDELDQHQCDDLQIEAWTARLPSVDTDSEVGPSPNNDCNGKAQKYNGDTVEVYACSDVETHAIDADTSTFTVEGFGFDSEGMQSPSSSR